MLDRIDIHTEVPAVPHEKLREAPAGESSKRLRREVSAARERQRRRQGCLNSALGVQATDQYCALEPPAARLLERAMAQLDLSARAYYRILRLARTVADLREEEPVNEEHVAEAIQLRTLDRRQ